MSRIGLKPITVPAGVEVQVKENQLAVKGKLGSLAQSFDFQKIKLEQTEGVIHLSCISGEKKDKALHGLYRALLFNMVEGVCNGFKTSLELVGVGYRATLDGQVLELALGYSHNILFQLPKEVTCSVVIEKGKNPTIHLQSCDKFLLGMVVAKLRSLRKKDPYKGKGILFVGEQIRRKAGKTAGKGKK